MFLITILPLGEYGVHLASAPGTMHNRMGLPLGPFSNAAGA